MEKGSQAAPALTGNEEEEEGNGERRMEAKGTHIYINE